MTAGYRLKPWVLTLFLIITPLVTNASLRTSSILQQTTQNLAWRCIPQGFCWKDDENHPWKWQETQNRSGVLHHRHTPLQLQWHILPAGKQHASSSQLRKEFELLGLEILQMRSQEPLLTLTVKTKNHEASPIWQQRLLSCHGQTLVLTGPAKSASWDFPEVICRE